MKEQKIFFSYFQVDQNYYLFVYAQKSIDINFLYQSIDVIQELDSKQRKIRSFRGFFLYGLEIMQIGENYEILKTNLQPFFWRKVKTIIRQNQKGALLEFLFGKGEDNKLVNQGSNPAFNDRIQNLQNQINSLHQKIIELEQNQTLKFKKALNELLKRSQASKIDQQDDSTLKNEHSPQEAIAPSESNKQSTNLTANDNKFSQQGEEPRNEISESVSEAKIRPVTPLSHSQNIPSNQEKGLQGANFNTLGKISEQERIEIIQRGFQLQAEGKISLKKYYESADQNSLFQFKGYSIKYESIRRTTLYQKLKP